jgi:hypothetical protein
VELSSVDVADRVLDLRRELWALVGVFRCFFSSDGTETELAGICCGKQNRIHVVARIGQVLPDAVATWQAGCTTAAAATTLRTLMVYAHITRASVRHHCHHSP